MPNQPRTPQRSVRIDDDLWDALTDEAAKGGTDRSTIIRRALRAYLTGASVLLVAVVLAGVTAQPTTAGRIFTEGDGVARWQQTTITVDASRVEGIDVETALAQWSGPIVFHVVEGEADVTLWRTHFSVPGIGGRATPVTDGDTITGCTVEVNADVEDDFGGVILAHEFGHCLGLGHAEAGIMATDVEAPGFSLTVTPDDLTTYRTIYRK